MRRLLLRLALSLFLVWPASLSLIDAYGLQDQARPAETIVILGSRVYPGNIAGPALVRRTQHAVALYKAGLAPVIICSGGQGEPGLMSEAEAACSLAAEMGVPRQALLLEDQAHSTEENARNTAVIMAAHGWHTAVVVSDGFHLYRADLLFRRIGLTPYTSPAQLTTGPMSPLERYGRETRELAALIWYWGKTAIGLQQTDFP
ncbi:MAG: YdcF family protein [Anaerolineales bacterium]